MNTVTVILNDVYKLEGSIDISIVYQLSDIREYDKRKGSSSYPFNIPGNKTNNISFGYIYNVQNDTQFNPNIKSRVKILVDTNIIFDGFLQLNRINRDNDGKVVSYDVTAYSNMITLFDDISNKQLCDLDLSEFDHYYTRENIIGSWNTFVIRNGSKNNFQKGTGYVYQYTNYNAKDAYNIDNPSPTNLNSEFFLPHPYVRTIWDKIFIEAGKTYTSEFISSRLFNSLTTSPNPDGLRITESIAKDFNFKSKLESEDYVGTFQNDLTDGVWWSSVYGKQILPYDYDLDGGAENPDYYDYGDNFNTTTHIYTVPLKCRMSFTALVNYSARYGITTDPCGWITFNGHLGEEKFSASLIRKRAGVETVIDSNILETTVNYSQTINCNPTRLRSLEVSCTDVTFLAGDEIFVRYDIYQKIKAVNSLGQQVGSKNQFSILPCDFYGNITNDIISEGNPIDFSSLMYCVSQGDFLRGIIRMFNLYLIQDPTNPDNIIIETRDDFYGSSNLINWDKKLMRDLHWDYTPMPEVVSKKIVLKYSSDGDLLNDDYQNSFKEETYGQYESDYTNEWQLGTNDTTIVFSPSPLVNETDTGRVIVDIYKLSNSIKQFYDGYNIRIFYYNGLVDTTEYTIFSNGVGDFKTTQYAYAGHIDSPNNNPTIDLNFNFSKKYYYEQYQVTPNNLFNTYWRNTIENIYNKNSKMFTGYFDLTPYDILNLDLRDYIFLDGAAWIINKIDGYNPSSSSPTRVELLMVTNQATINDYGYVNETLTIPLTGGEKLGYLIGSSVAPTIGNDITSTLNVNLANNTLSLGTRNTVTLGYNNWVHQGTSQSIIIGSLNETGALQNSISIGDNNKFGQVNNSLIFASNLDLTTYSVSNKLIFGTDSNYKSVNIEDIIDSAIDYVSGTHSYLIGTSSYIPVFNGTNSAINSDLYYSGTNLTNGSFLLSNTGQLLIGGTTYSSGPATTQMLTVKSPTQSFIVVESTSPGTEIGTIKFNNGSSTYNSIANKTTSMTLNAYARFVTNVNSVDAVIIDYGPRVGIIENATDATFKIKDSGVGYPFRISGTTSNTLLNYTNIGELVNKNDIEITGTASGYILRSPDNTRWRITIDNVGLISATSI